MDFSRTCVHFHAWMHYITRDLTKTGQLKKTEMEKQQLRNEYNIISTK